MMTIKLAQIERLRGAASRVANPQEPVPGGEGRADRRREQHRHGRLLPRVPPSIWPLGILQDLWPKRTPGLGFLRCGCRSLAFHLAPVEAHDPHSAAGWPHSSSGLLANPIELADS
jgi:hypothetical protein